MRSVHMESLVHRTLREAHAADEGYRAFSGRRSMETVTRDDIARYQLYRVRRMMEFACEHSTFYRELYAGVPEVASLEEISRMPFVTADDLRSSAYDMLCIANPDVASTFSHTTTGTTPGRPKRIFFGYADVDKIVGSMEAVLQTTLSGKGAGSVVHIFLPDANGPLSIAELIAMGVKRMGGTPAKGECFENTENQIRSIKEVKPDMIMGSCFRIWRMTQEARDYHDLRALGIRRIFITSEYLSTPMRRAMEECWGAEVYHHYGMSEPGFVIGIECEEHAGFHFNEADLLFEIIDPDTGRVLQDGEEGELVLTTLDRAAMPLLRYRTGDIASMRNAPCACGAETLVRIGELPRRTSGVVAVGKDGRIWSSMFDESLHRIPTLIDYRIFVDSQGGRDVLTCVAEDLGGESRALESALLRELRTIPVIGREESDGALDLRIKYAKRGDLRRGGRSQKRRIVDNRGVSVKREVAAAAPSSFQP